MWHNKTILIIIICILLCQILTILWFEGLITLKKKTNNNAVMTAVRRLASDQLNISGFQTVDLR